jgi:hypothetical protein
MKTKGSDIFKGFFAIILIFLLTVVFFHPVMFQGKTFYAFDTLRQHPPWSAEAPPNFRAHNTLITDPVNVFYPQYHLIKKYLDLKRTCFWNSNNFCGRPAAPPALPIVFLCYLLFPQSAAHDLILWIHLFGAGLFMLLYLRKIGLKTWPSLIGAIAWMFNGYVMVWFEFENIIILAPSFAAALYFLECWFDTKAKFHLFCMVFALGLQMISAQLLVYQSLFIACYFLYRYISLKRRHLVLPIDRKDILAIALAFLMGICIFANFFIGSFSTLHGDYQRREFSFESLYRQTGELPDSYLATLLFPDFFGSPAGRGINFTPRPNPPQPYNNYNELCIYAGVMPFLLGLVCIPWLFRKEHAAFYFFAGAVLLSMAMGGMLYYPLAKFIPGLNLSTPTRVLYVFGFCISVLAAIGADILISSRADSKKWVIILLWSLTLIGAVALVFFVRTEDGMRWAAADLVARNGWDQVHNILQEHFSFSSLAMLKPLGLILVSLITLVCLLFYKKEPLKPIFLFLTILILSYDLISFGLYYNTDSPKSLEYPQTEGIRFLKKDESAYRIITYGNFMHNSFAPFGIHDVGGYSSFYFRRYGEFLHLSQNGPDAPVPEKLSRWIFFNQFGSPLLDLINVKYVLFPPSVSVEFPKLSLVYDKEIKIYENKDAFPRAFFVPGYEYCESPESAYKTVGGYQASDFRKKVVLESLPPEAFRENSAPNSGESQVTILSYAADRIEIEVSADQNGFLVLSDNYDPSWIAKIEGKEIKVLRANYIMRAIPVKSGTHKIVLAYFPELKLAGFFITYAGWILLIGLIIYSFFVYMGSFFLK